MELVGGPQPIALTITFDPSNGAIGINGPIDNLLFCYGLMELAKITLFQHQQAKDNRITPVSILPQGLKS